MELILEFFRSSKDAFLHIEMRDVHVLEKTIK